MSVEGPERFTGGCLCGSVRIVASGWGDRRGKDACRAAPLPAPALEDFIVARLRESSVGVASLGMYTLA
ncbi:hypothetical protein [Stigmatella erecta]|uniref:Uncharacterized protein n=1 Tax=Stigmatella erecta TaxID=83460 RepID=A0A1I0LG34_9BACT|nr:hypothetical protein [Stigmatella erecta]SEU39131.1 hypothetical protein SAMN05443639_1332 [Stigmatella erecta]